MTKKCNCKTSKVKKRRLASDKALFEYGLKKGREELQKELKLLLGIFEEGA